MVPCKVRWESFLCVEVALTCRDWALIIPCYLMLVVLLAYLVYAGLTVYLTPPFDAAELVTGGSLSRELGKARRILSY